jgi:hypothetical protein
LFVVAFLAVSYAAESGFNPYPQTTTVSSSSTCASVGGGCPGFEIDGVSLSVHTYQDITSQELTLTITPRGNGPMARVSIFLDNVSLGVVEGPFAQGATSIVSAAVPTTIVVNPDSAHKVVVEGTYTDSAGSITATYWVSVDVVAS